MTIIEMIAHYEKIIESLRALESHQLEAIRYAAKIQIDRCNRSVRELKTTAWQFDI